MRISRIAMAAALLTAPAMSAAAAADGSIQVQIKLSCLPNPASLTLSDCKVLSVDPPQMASTVAAGAVARANASKMPADWQTSLVKEGARVIVPVTGRAEPRPGALAPAAPIGSVSSAPPSGNDVVVTLSCLPNPDLTVRACQVLSAKPDVSGAASAALTAVSKGKLDANWRSVYEVKDGRVILPVRMTKPGQ